MKKRPDLETTATRLRFTVARMNRLLRQQDNNGLGATASSVLATVNREGQPTLGELAATEQVAAPTITKVVDRLVEHGLVERRAEASDRRVCRVVLTPAGARHLEDNRTRRTAWLVGQLEGLPAADVAVLDRAAEVLEQLIGAPVPVRAGTTAAARPTAEGAS